MGGGRSRAFAPPCAGEPGWISAARSECGPMRPLNEDRLVDMPEAGLWAVADGMGGHRAGDVAAQMVADALVAAAADGALSSQRLDAALQSVNAALVGQRSPGMGGTSGATVVALLLSEGRYICLWAGDSRAYRMRAGGLEPISRDHSLVQEMVDAGVITPAEARVHPRANVITRAVGVADPLRLDMATGEVADGEMFLLCSDGLVGALREDRIAEILAEPDLERAADTLIAAAVAAPARDNVTLVLVSHVAGQAADSDSV